MKAVDISHGRINSTFSLKSDVVESTDLVLAISAYAVASGNISSTHAIDVIADDSSKISVSVATNRGVRQTPW